VPCPDEITQGKADILTADVRTHLPFSLSLSRSLNHGQMQDDSSLQHAVCNIVLSALQSVWQNSSGLLIAKNADGRLEVFRCNPDQTLSHTWQTSPGAGWSGWFPSEPGAQTASSLIAGQNTSGSLEIFALGLDSAIYHTYQTADWVGWSQIPGDGQGKSLSVGSNADGRFELFLIGSDNTVWQTRQTDPSSESWSGWFLLGLGVQTATSLTVGQNANEMLEVFALSLDGFIYHTNQIGWRQMSGGR
jgi:hypothetical protein